MVIIGLTGGIGAGKSAVSQRLASHGAVVVDTALLGHEAYAPGTQTWQRISEAFGAEALRADGSVNRQRLGAIVFGDAAALDRLNAIMRPAIGALLTERLDEARAQGAPAAVIDSATLIEAGWDALADEVWVTSAPEDAVYARLRARDGLSDEDIARRIAAQLPDEARQARADVVIPNDGGLEALHRAVDTLWNERIRG